MVNIVIVNISIRFRQSKSSKYVELRQIYCRELQIQAIDLVPRRYCGNNSGDTCGLLIAIH